MKEAVEKTLSEIIDPELHVDIVSLGLIYEINVDENNVHVKMTLTTPACPYGPALLEEVKEKVKSIDGVNDAEVEVTFSPPWSPDKMNDEARMTLGM